MEQKYTIEEFKKLFDKAKIEVLEKMGKEFEQEGLKNGKADSMTTMAFNLQNILCITELKLKLFSEEDLKDEKIQSNSTM